MPLRSDPPTRGACHSSFAHDAAHTRSLAFGDSLSRVAGLQAVAPLVLHWPTWPSSAPQGLGRRRGETARRGARLAGHCGSPRAHRGSAPRAGCAHRRVATASRLPSRDLRLALSTTTTTNRPPSAPALAAAPRTIARISAATRVACPRPFLTSGMSVMPEGWWERRPVCALSLLEALAPLHLAPMGGRPSSPPIGEGRGPVTTGIPETPPASQPPNGRKTCEGCF